MGGLQRGGLVGLAAPAGVMDGNASATHLRHTPPALTGAAAGSSGSWEGQEGLLGRGRVRGSGGGSVWGGSRGGEGVLGGAGGVGSGAAGVRAIKGVGGVVGTVVAAGGAGVGAREGPWRVPRASGALKTYLHCHQRVFVHCDPATSPSPVSPRI